MKILKIGIPKADRLWRGQCRECRSIIQATQSELTNIRTDQRDGSHSWEVCIVCDAGQPESGYGGVCFYPLSEGEGK